MRSTRLDPVRLEHRSGWERVLRCAVVLCALALPHAGQGHLGYDFWLADPSTSAPTFTIAIGNPSTVTASVSIFNVIEGTTPGSVAPGATMTYTFPTHEVAGTVVSSNPVYHVTSDVEVAVFAFDPLVFAATNDACLVLPVPALGKRHRIAQFVQSTNSGPTFAGAVALSPGLTNVKVIDDTQTVIDNVNLLAGQYFQRASTADLTGWEVVADKPVAVFSGNVVTSIGNPFCCGDVLLEQLLPDTKLATAYVVVPLRTRPLGCTTPATCAADLFRFVATKNNTTLTTTPNVGGGTLNEGDFLELATATSFVIRGDEPFFAYQYLPSYAAKYGTHPAANTGDPSLLDVIPTEQFRLDYIVHVESTYASSFLNLVAPTGTSLLLDNVSITPAWDPIGTLNGTSYVSGHVAVSSGPHRVTSLDKPFGLTVTGFDFQGSYAYVAGLGNPCVAEGIAWMKDDPSDTGNEPNPSNGNLWDSPDIWLRNQQDANLQFQHQNQNPIPNVPNYVYVKLRNRGCAPLTEGDVVTYFAKLSTGTSWSTNWIGSATNGDVIGTQPVGFLAANGEKILEYAWTPPSAGPFGLLARLVSSEDPMTFVEGASVFANAKNNNNIAWKNSFVLPEVTTAPGVLTDVAVIVRNVESTATLVDIELGEPGSPLATSFLAYGSLRMSVPPALYQAWQQAGGSSVGLSLVPGTTTFRVTATSAALTGVPLGVAEEHPLVLHFASAPNRPPRLRKHAALEPFVIRQRSTGSATPDGGVTFTFPRTEPVELPR